MELVSVLIPCRNAAPWISAALDSALRQTGVRIEVIVVENGSNDGSYEIARNFASNRCQVVRQEPRGASAARNHALLLAQGDYIQYLDADDLLEPGKIARQIVALRDHGPRALSWSSAVYLLNDGVDSIHEEARAPSATATEFLARLWGGDGDPGMMFVHQWLAPRKLIEAAGPWNETLTFDDDGEFFSRVVLAASTRVAVPEASCIYRKFHRRENLSAAGAHGSAIQAACLKSSLLLQHANNALSQRAVSRLLTQAIVDAYPDPAHGRGLDFLRAQQLGFTRDLAAPPWFQRTAPVIGWKATRRLQDFARAVRRRHLAFSGPKSAAPGRPSR